MVQILKFNRGNKLLEQWHLKAELEGLHSLLACRHAKYNLLVSVDRIVLIQYYLGTSIYVKRPYSQLS